MRIPLTLLVLIPFFCFLSLPAFAGGFQLYLAGSRQLAMAHTGVGNARGAATMFFNPGAMAFIPKSSIQVGGSLAFPSTAFLGNFAPLEITETETKSFSPIYFYAAWKPHAESKLCLGIGANSPFGYMIKWPDEWTGKNFTREVSITSLFVQPTISYQLSPKFSLGAGLVYGNMTLLMRRALRVYGQPNNNSSSVSFTGNGFGWGFNAGLYFKTDETFSFGISLRSPIKPVIKGTDVEFDVPKSLVDSFRATSFSADLALPGVINLGIGYRPQETLLLLFDINYTGWSVYDTLRIDFDENSAIFEDDITPREFKNAFAFRLGGEYIVNENVVLRLGGYYDSSPVEEGFVSPELPDADKVGFTAGIGLVNILGHLSLDAGFEYSTTGERTTFFQGDNQGPEFLAGVYQSNAYIAGLGLSYSF